MTASGKFLLLKLFFAWNKHVTPHYTDKRSGRFQNKGEEAFLFYSSYRASKWNLGGGGSYTL